MTTSVSSGVIRSAAQVDGNAHERTWRRRRALLLGSFAGRRRASAFPHALLAPLAALTLSSTPLRAQVSRALDSGAATLVWLSGGIGGGAGQRGTYLPSASVALAAELAVAHGPLMVAYHSASIADFGDHKGSRALIVGARVPWDALSFRAAVGPGWAHGCRSNGEQSGTQTCFGWESARAFELAIDATSHYGGVYVSAFDVHARTNGFHGLTVGVVLGKLR